MDFLSFEMLIFTPLNSVIWMATFPKPLPSTSPVMLGVSYDYLSIYLLVNSKSLKPYLILCEWTGIIVSFVCDILFWNSPRWHHIYQVHGFVVPEMADMWQQGYAIYPHTSHKIRPGIRQLG